MIPGIVASVQKSGVPMTGFLFSASESSTPATYLYFEKHEDQLRQRTLPATFDGNVMGASFSPEGNYMAVWTRAGQGLYVFKRNVAGAWVLLPDSAVTLVATGGGTQQDAKRAITGIAISANARYMYFAGTDRVQTVKKASGADTWAVSGTMNAATMVSPANFIQGTDDGAMFVAAYTTPNLNGGDSNIIGYVRRGTDAAPSLAASTKVTGIGMPGDVVASMSLSGDGKYVAAVRVSGLAMWRFDQFSTDAAKWSASGRAGFPTTGVSQVALSTDASRMAIIRGNNIEVYLWNGTTYTLEQSTAIPAGITRPTLVANGAMDYIVQGGASGAAGSLSVFKYDGATSTFTSIAANATALATSQVLSLPSIRSIDTQPDGPTNWNTIPASDFPGGIPSNWQTLSSNGTNKIVTSGVGGQTHRSDDSGDTWTPLTVPSGYLIALVWMGGTRWVCKFNTDSGPLYRVSTDDCVSWSATMTPPGTPSGNAVLPFPDPNTPGRAIVACGLSLYLTTDGMATMTGPIQTFPSNHNVTSVLTDGMGTWVAVINNNPLGKISISRDNGATWTAPIQLAITGSPTLPVYGTGIWTGNEWILGSTNTTNSLIMSRDLSTWESLGVNVASWKIQYNPIDNSKVVTGAVPGTPLVSRVDINTWVEASVPGGIGTGLMTNASQTDKYWFACGGTILLRSPIAT